MITDTQTHTGSSRPDDPLYATHLENLTKLGINVDEDLRFIKELNLYFRLCNLPLSNGRQTSSYQLDVLHQPKVPCHVYEVSLEVFDTTDGRERILRGQGHAYLSFILHKERTFEIADGQGFSKRISWISKTCWD